MFERNVHFIPQCSFHFHASCEFSTRAATFPFQVDTSLPQLMPRVKLHLHLSYVFICSYTVSKCCFQLFECTVRSLTCSVPVCQLNPERAPAEHANRHVFVLFFSPDGSSKHVILFDNMEEELVTIGFV